jgi:hypothetical protein
MKPKGLMDAASVAARRTDHSCEERRLDGRCCATGLFDRDGKERFLGAALSEPSRCWMTVVYWMYPLEGWLSVGNTSPIPRSGRYPGILTATDLSTCGGGRACGRRVDVVALETWRAS